MMWITFVEKNDGRITLRSDDILMVEVGGLCSRIVFRGPLGNIIFEEVSESEARRMEIALRSGYG